MGEGQTPPNWDGTGEMPTPPQWNGENGEMASQPDGEFKGNGEMPSGFRGGMKGGIGQSPNALGVMTTYFGIMAVFAILTHYLGKINLKRKTKIMAS